MVTASGARHPLFRPNPGLNPAPGAKARGPAVPASLPQPGPEAQTWPSRTSSPPGLWTAVPIRRAKPDMKVRLLRIGGLVVMLAGAAAVAYVVNAVWISGARADRAQQQLAADFAAAQETTTTSTTTTTLVEDDPTIGPITSTTLDPAADTDRPALHANLLPIIGEEPPAPTEALGRIVIPSIGVDWMLVEGVTADALANGPGHIPGTAMPGQPGNAVISGHRTTYGAPFFNIDALQPGDVIEITTLIGVHTYEVVQQLIVAPNDVWVTNQVDGAWLTLTACHPRYSARERIIIFARLTDGPNYEAIASTMTGSETWPQPPEGWTH
jgi:LPXTG-site transpeptidase (sortase) family protein